MLSRAISFCVADWARPMIAHLERKRGETPPICPSIRRRDTDPARAVPDRSGTNDFAKRAG